MFDLIKGYFLNQKFKPRVIQVYKKQISRQDVIEANIGLFDNKILEWKNFTHIIEHHSFTKDGQIKDTIGIWKYHTSYRIDGNAVSKTEYFDRLKNKKGIVFELPDLTIGYNALIEEVSNQIMVYAGRPLTMNGAHTKGFNDKSIGVCWIGNFDSTEPSSDKYEVYAITTKKYIKVFNIPVQNVLGHREANKISGLPFKSCPGFKVDMDKFRSLVNSIPDSKLI
jgi:N-acetylmuramoyl-L-alanine amidase